MKKEDLLKQLQWEDPFAGFTPHSAPESWSWHYDEAFLQSVYARVPRPQLIAEVGSWLGRSAIEAANYYTRRGWQDFTLICIDTWLGSAEHWLQPGLARNLPRINGYPVYYEQFLSNLALAGLSEQILPLPQTSLNASRILFSLALSFDWVYLDASHDQMDVLMDLSMYWPLVKPGGALFGDDVHWRGVRAALDDFCKLHGLIPETSEKSWAIWKR